MARPLKTGLDYFPCDVNFDDAFKALEELHGNDGHTWMIKFWQAAFKTQNGMVDLKGPRGILMAKQSRISIPKQAEIIKDAIQLNLLTENMPDYYTSDWIQNVLTKINSDREMERNRKRRGFPGG